MFIRYCLSKFKQEMTDKAYRVYVTDVLKMVAENTAKSNGGGYVKMRFIDAIERKKPDERTAEEVKHDIFKKLKR